MKFEIKSRYNDSILFSTEADSPKLAVEAAVKSGADLSDTNLSRADLSGADLSYTNLSDTNLTNTTGLYSITPEVGSFDGFKKLSNGTICRIRIPEEAGRVGGYSGRKCRAEFAVVIFGEGTSQFDKKTIYLPGTTVVPDSWDPDPRVECSHGIHFFLTRREAKEYDY